MEVIQALTLMIAFGMFTISLIGLIVKIVLAITNKKK